MKKNILLIILFLSFIFPFIPNEYKQTDFETDISSYKINVSNYLLDKFIDEDTYVIGPGDVFLFNMVTSNRILNLELITSPTGDVLIPIIGTIDIKGKILKNAYEIIINKCKEKYEDAFVYINLIKLRQFKVLITGNSNRAGMHIVSSTDKVSDLIESIYSFTYLDTLLSKHLFDYPKNIMIGKDINLIRTDSLIPINLFDYYMSGDDSENPILIEGDIVNIKNTSKITVLGEVNKPIRIKRENLMTYNNLLELAGGPTSIGDLNKIKFLNYTSISSYYNNEKNRISQIEPKYRSDTDESFLSARNKTLDGVVYISDNLKLEDFLNLEVLVGDILIVPPKNNFIEVLGGVNNPGMYLYSKNKNVYGYILNAGGYNEMSKDIYILELNSGSRTKVNKTFIPEPGSVIFIEERIGYKKWDRIKDMIGIVASIASSLLIITNVLGW